MSTVEESIDIDVPVSTAYRQWTQFESFPSFMDGIERVERLDARRLHWVAEIGGVRREWDAAITEEQADQRIAWKAIDQDGPDGIVSFQRLDEGRTRVKVQMDYEPKSVKELVGSVVGLDDRRVKEDLEAFKELVERR